MVIIFLDFGSHCIPHLLFLPKEVRHYVPLLDDIFEGPMIEIYSYFSPASAKKIVKNDPVKTGHLLGLPKELRSHLPLLDNKH
jgi:hypothetical protein